MVDVDSVVERRCARTRLMPHLLFDWLTAQAARWWPGPENCIAPRICPHTRWARNWSLPEALQRYVGEVNANNTGRLYGSVIFHCVHRTWGVEMIDAAPIVDADAYA